MTDSEQRGPQQPDSDGGTSKKSSRQNGTRPLIIINDRDLRDITQDALEALEQSNDPDPFIFQHGTRLARLAGDLGGRFLQPLDEDRLTHHLAEIADWRAEVLQGKKIRLKPVFPIVRVIKNVLATPLWPVPAINRIVTGPPSSLVTVL